MMKAILLLLLTCNLQYHSPLLEKVALAMGAGERNEARETKRILEKN
jgi:hypothetical protein